MKRYYYKSKDGTAWLNLKTPDYADHKDYVEITEKEWNDHIEELESSVPHEEE